MYLQYSFSSRYYKRFCCQIERCCKQSAERKIKRTISKSALTLAGLEPEHHAVRTLSHVDSIGIRTLSAVSSNSIEQSRRAHAASISDASNVTIVTQETDRENP